MSVAVFVAVAAYQLASAGSGEHLPRVVINYVGNHRGKIAALAHFNVIKTSEPLTCYDGIVNFTCVISKTDIKPILNALLKAGVEAEAVEINATWVLASFYNYE
ncbi:hypothetical protein CGL51_14205 [Pyrobaculum aerophilum]|uniref:Uncharacterized protein n=2 Tax=Pyrobaculum aerophilum TaxID=13773 RepID=A0A371QU98_9CREN|nr:hypothetical protein CGL51_14205 [Pyrobaculum aerophilum]RFA99016.1 hypothetical protein CGL52_05870 [Pyrobaculum aerophilum]